MGNLDVLDQHGHLFVGHEALEVVPRLLVVVREDVGVKTGPEHTPGVGEQVLHESSLARKLNLDRTLTDASDSTTVKVLMMLLNGLGSILQGVELDVSVSGLASDTLHDDVNRFISVVEHTGVAAQDCNDLGAVGNERNLARC